MIIRNILVIMLFVLGLCCIFAFILISLYDFEYRGVVLDEKDYQVISDDLKIQDNIIKNGIRNKKYKNVCKVCPKKEEK